MKILQKLIVLLVSALNTFQSANIECPNECNLDDKSLNPASRETTDACAHKLNEKCKRFAKTCAYQIQNCFPKLTDSIRMLKDWPKTQVFIYKAENNNPIDGWNFEFFRDPDCLGTLLSKKIVLTSASCIFGRDVSRPRHIVRSDIAVVYANNALNDRVVSWKWKYVKSVKYHPEFIEKADLSDTNVAILIFDKRITNWPTGIAKLREHRPQEVPG